MSDRGTHVWLAVLLPVPAAGVCVACYSWRVGLTPEVLSAAALALVCAVALGAAFGVSRRH